MDSENKTIKQYLTDYKKHIYHLTKINISLENENDDNTTPENQFKYHVIEALDNLTNAALLDLDNKKFYDDGFGDEAWTASKLKGMAYVKYMLTKTDGEGGREARFVWDDYKSSSAQEIYRLFFRKLLYLYTNIPFTSRAYCRYLKTALKEIYKLFKFNMDSNKTSSEKEKSKKNISSNKSIWREIKNLKNLK